MRRSILLGLILFGIIASSCQKRTVYREFRNFKNYTWERFDKITFEIPVDDADFTADIILSLRHLEEFQYAELPVNVIFTLPSGEERIVEKRIWLKDENGQFKGSVAGSLWDYDEVLWKSFHFNQEGTYTIEIENLIPKVGTPFLVDIGLTVRKN